MADKTPRTQKNLDKRSKDIASMVPYWDKTDAIVEGFDKIKQGGKEYLPMFADEVQADYEVRLNNTKFTNIYRDVLEGLSTKPFEEEVTLLGDKVPEEIKKFTEDVDGSGNNLTNFAASTFFSGINSAIEWIFIDYPTVNTDEVKTRADEKARGIKPFWSQVLGRNVLSAKSMIVNGKELLSYIKILEPNTDGPDHIRIMERNENGVVIWELWQKKEAENVKTKSAESEWILINEGTLTIDVIPMVPFITGRRDGKTFKFYPVMRDAADLQIILYQDESALQYVKKLAGYPMLAGNGIKPPVDAKNVPLKLAIGPAKVLYGAPDGAGNHGTWAYVEPNANTMKFLQENIDKTKLDLRELGRQPLTAQSGQLTVITTAVAAGKARSAVGAWALNLKDALQNALDITAKWLKIEYTAEVNVYNEFDKFADSGADVTALTTMRGAGDLSQETYWSEMKRRKVLSPEFDAEEERERILNEIPSEGDGENPDPDDEKDLPNGKKPIDKKKSAE